MSETFAVVAKHSGQTRKRVISILAAKAAKAALNCHYLSPLSPAPSGTPKAPRIPLKMETDDFGAQKFLR